jgi:hypothetical protein
LGSGLFGNADSWRVSLFKPKEMIEKEAFAQCEKLVNVELAEGLEKIMEGAFLGCKSLKCIHLPSTVKTFATQYLKNMRT